MDAGSRAGNRHERPTPRALTCATSLSPRPLRQTNTGSSALQRPAWLATHAMACAVSSAGMMPSARLNHLEAAQRIDVGHGDVRRAPAVLEKGVLGTHAGIVEARRDRVRGMHLAVRVLQQIAERAVEHAGRTTQLSDAAWRPVVQSLTRGLHADQLDIGVVDKAREDAHGSSNRRRHTPRPSAAGGLRVPGSVRGPRAR